MDQGQDLWSHPTNQGKGYAQHRPNYPKEFYDKIWNLTAKKQNYLDVGSGTGQVFFKCYEQFNGIRIAVEPSNNMRQQAQNELEKQEYDRSLIKIIPGFANDLPDILPSIFGPSLKFDLITVGQALHWFDVEKFFQQVKDQLLNDENSVFVVMAYFPYEIDINLKKIIESENVSITEAEMKDIQPLFAIYDKRFYQVIKDHYENNQENMKYYYKDYWYMTKYFTRIEFLRKKESLELTLVEFISYCKTFSGYNTYLKISSCDPAKDLEDQLQSNWEMIRKKYQIQTTELPLLFHHDYYLYIMRK